VSNIEYLIYCSRFIEGLSPKQNSMTNNNRQRRSTSNRSSHKYSSTNSRQHVDDRSPLLDNIYIPHGGRLKK
jgi:hypothetical protein